MRIITYNKLKRTGKEGYTIYFKLLSWYALQTTKQISSRLHYHHHQGSVACSIPIKFCLGQSIIPYMFCHPFSLVELTMFSGIQSQLSNLNSSAIILCHCSGLQVVCSNAWELQKIDCSGRKNRQYLCQLRHNRLLVSMTLNHWTAIMQQSHGLRAGKL
jgi:hypothetical protein